jgi:hypothetical protein
MGEFIYPQICGVELFRLLNVQCYWFICQYSENNSVQFLLKLLIIKGV